MGGSLIDDDWEDAASSDEARTIVLVGRTGNGKSATGNSILGENAFLSRRRTSGVTSTCEKQKIILRDGEVINVIDTPGLFDFSDKTINSGKEIANCINLAKNGIHAVIIVFSVKTRFSIEEGNAFQALQKLFGDRITDYAIVVFTGGDEIEEDGGTLEDYLGDDCPEPLKQIIKLCDNRVVLFNNRTTSPRKKAEQVEKLLWFVNLIVAKNGGKPYTDELFTALQEGAVKLHDELESARGCSKQEMEDLKKQIYKSYDEQLKRMTEMVELKLLETTRRLEEQLAAEQAQRKLYEKMANAAKTKSENEMKDLREALEKAQKETENLRKENNERKCSIL